MQSNLILKNQQRLDLKIFKRSECQIKPRLILSLSSIRQLLNSAPKGFEPQVTTGRQEQIILQEVMNVMFANTHDKLLGVLVI